MNHKTTIGGALDYRLLAEQHRPHDDATIAREIKRLIEQGLTERDVATAIRIDLAALRRLAGPSWPYSARASGGAKYR